MAGYFDLFQLHNDTDLPLAKHVRHLLVRHQAQLDIQVTSASVHRLPTQQFYTQQIPRLLIDNSIGNYRIKVTRQAQQELNTEAAITHRILAWIANQHHNYYQLPDVPQAIIEQSGADTIFGTYADMVDSTTHQYLFGKLSNQTYAQKITLPRVRARSRLINILEATNNSQLQETVGAQHRDYAAIISAGLADSLRKDGLQVLARHASLELRRIYENDNSSLDKLHSLVDYYVTQQSMIDLQETQKHASPQFKKRPSGKVLMTRYIDDFLELGKS